MRMRRWDDASQSDLEVEKLIEDIEDTENAETLKNLETFEDLDENKTQKFSRIGDFWERQKTKKTWVKRRER